MPLIEYGCYDCKKISEALIRDRYNIPESAPCEHCKGENTVNFSRDTSSEEGEAWQMLQRDGGCRREDVRDGGADSRMIESNFPKK